MPLCLHPFPQHYHPPFGVADNLPVCRDGVKQLLKHQLVQFNQPAFAELIIRRHANHSSSRGICGLVPAAAFLDGRIKPHEETLRSRLERQEQLVLEDEGALGKPILITVPSLSDWWAAQDQHYSGNGKDIEFSGDDNFYRLRTYLPGKHLSPQPLSLDGLGTMVIADGHHRAATHARLDARGVEACKFVPVCIIGADELHVGIFARIIQDERKLEELLPAISTFFDLESVDSPHPPSRAGEWLMVSDDKFFRLNRKAGSAALHDAEWLEHTVLPVVFGILDTRADERITFEPIVHTPQKEVPLFAAKGRISLYGYPVSDDDFFAQVEKGKCFPPKSTRFEPRVPSGLVVWVPEDG